MDNTSMEYPLQNIDDNLSGTIMQPSDITEYMINSTNQYHYNTVSCPIQCIPVKYENTLRIKEELINIINKQVEIIEINNEEFKDEEIDELVEKIENKIPKIMELQNDLNKLHKEYIDSSEKTKKDVTTIDNSVRFMENIEGEYDKNKEVKEIIDKLNSYSKKILENEKLTTIRNNYIEKLKELNSYLYFIQKLNKWNLCNMCPMCFTNKVDVFCNPCGHTGCRICFEKQSQSQSVHIINNNKCPFCREYIIDLKPLYYL
jgi:hypothetical protein